MRAKSKPTLLVAPAADEQALLAAYRTMDDRARDNTLRIAIRTADQWPGSEQRSPRRTIMVATEADEQALLNDFRAMDEKGKDDAARFAAFVRTQSDRRRPALRLVIGSRS